MAFSNMRTGTGHQDTSDKTKTQDPPQLFFAWTGFQRRQVSMATLCGFETVFLPVKRRQSIVTKAWTYAKHSWTMFRLLQESRPRVVWIQLPQVPLLWVALLYKWQSNNRVVVISDCHNAMFRKPWSKFPFGLSLLSKSNVVLVHNADVEKKAIDLGIDQERLLVVEDPPASFPIGINIRLTIDLPRPWFVFPASFASDEPIMELLTAANAIPDVSILITGNLKNAKEPTLISQAPPNVRFLGFLERTQFESLIQTCDAVIAFTRLDDVQLSVCGEAVGAERPMLVSGTTTLRRQFPRGTVFVDSSEPSDIAAGMRHLHENQQQLTEEMRAFHRQFRDDWLRLKGKELAERIGRV
jgi:hypothetical protein